jgi:hypothetical protein
VNFIRKKMKAVLVVAVITCVFVVGLAQTQKCMNCAAGLTSCISQVASTGNRGGNFCNDCANRLNGYYRDCTNGVGVDAVRLSRFNSIVLKSECNDNTCSLFLTLL